MKSISLFLKKNKKLILRFADAFLSASALFIGLQLLTLKGDEKVNGFTGFVLFLVIALSRLFHAFYLDPKLKARKIKDFVFTGVFVICAILFLVLNGSTYALVIVSCFYLLEVIVTRVIIMIMKKKVLSYILNGLLVFIVFLSILAYLAFSESEYLIMTFIIAFIIVSRSLLHIIVTSFNDIKLGILRKILRKTFAGEILFGLLMLMIAFSMVFVRVEPETFPTYESSLWYCFALVTTIGFGDITAASRLCRILSVILGLYGIIFVALVTSVIVNFYNEVKKEKDDDELDLSTEEKQEEKVEEENKNN